MTKQIDWMAMTIKGTKTSGSESVDITYNCRASEYPDLVSPPKTISMPIADFMLGATILTPQQASVLWTTILNAAEQAEGLELSQPSTLPDWPNGTKLTANINGTSVTLSWQTPFSPSVITKYKIYVDSLEVFEVEGMYNTKELSVSSGVREFQVQASLGDLWTTDGPKLSVTIP